MTFVYMILQIRMNPIQNDLPLKFRTVVRQLSQQPFSIAMVCAETPESLGLNHTMILGQTVRPSDLQHQFRPRLSRTISTLAKAP